MQTLDCPCFNCTLVAETGRDQPTVACPWCVQARGSQPALCLLMGVQAGSVETRARSMLLLMLLVGAAAAPCSPMSVDTSPARFWPIWDVISRLWPVHGEHRPWAASQHCACSWEHELKACRHEPDRSRC